MKMRLLDVGFGYSTFINADKVTAIAAPESAPIKRLVSEAKDKGLAVDATYGRKTRSVIIMDSDQIILSPLKPETVVSRASGENT